MKRILVFVTLIALFEGCYYDKSQKLYPSSSNDSCSTANVTYSGVVQPIIAQNCALSGCHDANATNGFLLDNYTHVKTYAANGQLVGTISHASGFPQMPLSGSLTTCQINQIKTWVNAGYPNN